MVLSVITPPFDRPEVLAKLRPLFEAQRWLVLPGACRPGDFRPRFRKLDVPDRGRYDFADLRPFQELHEFAQALTGARLKHRSTRLVRLRWRSYSLFFDDAKTRIENGVELTLDLSRAAVGPAAIYEPGRIEVPQAPGIVAVVERNPSMFRYDRYLPAQVGNASVLRLRAAYEYGR